MTEVIHEIQSNAGNANLCQDMAKNGKIIDGIVFIGYNNSV